MEFKSIICLCAWKSVFLDIEKPVFTDLLRLVVKALRAACRRYEYCIYL